MMSTFFSLVIVSGIVQNKLQHSGIVSMSAIVQALLLYNDALIRLLNNLK